MITVYRLLSLALILVAPTVSAETLVVANKGENTASLIDLESGEVAATLPTGEGPHEVGISGDGVSALVTNYGRRGAPGSSLTVIDITTAKVTGTIDLGDYQRPHGVVWLSDDRRAVVTAEGNRALLVVDIEGGAVEAAIDTAQEISHMVALSADEERAFVANIGSSSVTVIDLVRRERIANVPTGDGAEGVAVAGGQAWVTNRAADTITVLDAVSLEPLATLESPGFPIRATAAGSRILVTRARADDLAVYDVADLGAMRRIDLHIEAKDGEGRLFGDRFGDSSVPIGVVADDAGRRAWIAHANADVISELVLESGKVVRRLTAGREPDGMGYSAKTSKAAEP